MDVDCPSGWKKSVIPGKCFRLMRKKQTAESASKTCADQGGALASIESQAETDFLIHKVVHGVDTDTLLGGMKNSTGSWYWQDGGSFNYTSWGTNAVAMVTNPYYDSIYLVTHPSAYREVYFGKWGIGKFDTSRVYYPLCSLMLNLH